jgi:hypothetical protein
MIDWTAASLWLAVLISGLYHGINPGMGWPLAVSAALMGGGRRGLLTALGSLAGGHFLAMGAILLPFAVLTALVAWQQEIRIVAGLAVVTAGLYLLINRRHPRFLARIRPTQLAAWSFAIATVHGAGLMLVPIYLGLCRAEELDPGDVAASILIGGSLITAVIVATAHTIAMLASGGAIAFAVHEWLGPKAIARNWFNLETIWALCLVLIGGIGLASARIVGQ